MWLAENMKHTAPAADAEQGVSTIVGEQMGVVTRGEVRQLPVYGPGGEEQCVCGQKQPAAPGGMQPGEVCLCGPGDSRIYLRKNGTIELSGRVSINGTLLVNGQAYKPCSCGGGGIL